MIYCTKEKRQQINNKMVKITIEQLFICTTITTTKLGVNFFYYTMNRNEEGNVSKNIRSSEPVEKTA